MTFATTRETVFGEQATGMIEEIMPTRVIGEGSRLYRPPHLTRSECSRAISRASPNPASRAALVASPVTGWNL